MFMIRPNHNLWHKGCMQNVHIHACIMPKQPQHVCTHTHATTWTTNKHTHVRKCTPPYPNKHPQSHLHLHPPTYRPSLRCGARGPPWMSWWRVYRSVTQPSLSPGVERAPRSRLWWTHMARSTPWRSRWGTAGSGDVGMWGCVGVDVQHRPEQVGHSGEWG